MLEEEGVQGIVKTIVFDQSTDKLMPLHIKGLLLTRVMPSSASKAHLPCASF
jgi:hypothetical protein